MASLGKEIGLVSTPLYSRPWALYVLSLGVVYRSESEQEGLKEKHKLEAYLQKHGKSREYVVWGPVYEPDTERYDLSFGALRKDAPSLEQRQLIHL